MSTVEVSVPDIGDAKDVEVIEVLVKVGDRISVDQSLATLETDKASMEIPSTSAGVVSEIRLKVGDKVSQGSLVLILKDDAAAETVPARPAAQAAEKPAEKPVAQAASASDTAPAKKEPAASGSLSGGTLDIAVPDIGDATDVEVIEVLVKEGDTVALDQSLATLETDKASMEIPATAAGVVRQLKIKVGDRVSAGTPLLVLETTEPAAAPAPRPVTEAMPEKPAVPALRPWQSLSKMP